MTADGAANRSTERAIVRALPSGTVVVGVGLIVLGISSYVFLALAARALSPAGFSTLSVLWVAVYTVGPGLFLPLEQEVGRALADRRARGVGGAPVFRRAAALGLGLAVLLVAIAAGAGPAYVSVLFDGSTGMLVALLASVVALWGAHLCRGALAGGGDFTRYGLMLAVEGIGRAAGCALLAIAAVRWAPGYGLLVPAALAASVLVVVSGAGRVATPGPTTSWQELSGALGWLLAGSLLAQLLVNVGPIAVKALASASEHDQAGQFLAGSVLVRVPLFLFAAVQAALLPGLADLAGRGNYAEFAQRLRRLLLLIGAVGVVATVGSAVAGTTLLRWFFGSNFHLGVGLLVQLAIANSVYMLGLVLGQALVALRHYTTVAVSWAAGVLTFVVVSSFGGSILQRAAHGFVAGTVLVVIVLAVRVTRAIQQREQVAPERIRLGGYPLFEE